MTDNRKNITQPADWWAAFQAAADAAGMSLSEWMGEQCRKALPKCVKLSERKPANRSKKQLP